MDLAWWIAVIAVPLVGSVFFVDGLIHSKAAESSRNLHGRIDMLAAQLSDYKLTAAEKFATNGDIGKLEAHLQRIEDKMDRLVKGRTQRDRP